MEKNDRRNRRKLCNLASHVTAGIDQSESTIRPAVVRLKHIGADRGSGYWCGLLGQRVVDMCAVRNVK